MAVHRIEVRVGRDPRADAVVRDAASIGVRLASARLARVYLIEGDLTDDNLTTIRDRLLADPVTESAVIGADYTPMGAEDGGDGCTIEVHPLPGVMDPVAQSVQKAVLDLTGDRVRVSTGVRYDLSGIPRAEARVLADRMLANGVVHAVHTEPYWPDALPTGHAYQFSLRHMPLRGLDDHALARLSREAHLFLSLDEMRTIRDAYRVLGREPTDVELETLAQTWSEHCVHKTLKSKIVYRGQEEEQVEMNGEGGVDGGGGIDWRNRPGHTINADGSVTIDNLLKSTVAAATHELIADGVDWTLSVFVDNAGIIAFDDEHAVCVKVETHNHPSALEPYGGAATGIGGCIRDVIGTGLAARPIANTDVFCVAHPDRFSKSFTTEDTEEHRNELERDSELADIDSVSHSSDISSHSESQSSSLCNSVSTVVNLLPTGCLHPRRILSRVVAGVRDYGNRMGIPTVNGAVSFDDRYVGNPLVYCGCVGIMPRDRVGGEAGPGDRIIVLGGRTGRDGIHGATFSSAELTDAHADEFSHAVQIGNAIEEKRVLDAILRARDYAPSSQTQQYPMPDAKCLYSAITDCGAGGFSSAVGEMGERIGAEVELANAPLKYEGLSYTEIWISEAQERMVLAVPPENVPALQRICDEEHVELADLGHFGTDKRELILRYDGVEVGRLPMDFLHDGIPTPTRVATWGIGRFTTEDTEGHGEERERSADKIRYDSVSDIGNTYHLSESHSSTPCNSVSSVVDSVPIEDALLALLAHPDVASKHWIVSQYDHEVQGATVVKPLVGPGISGPGDGAVIEPVPGTGRGLAIASGLQTRIGDPENGGDPYLMALAAIDECVRNLVCVGADPERIAILDNFCWPSCEKPENLGSLVRAAEGCYDGAKAYRTPFVSGKDSLNNQFKTDTGDVIEIPPTLLITGVGIVPDIARCVTSDAKRSGNILIVIGDTNNRMGGSLWMELHGGHDAFPGVDLEAGPRTARVVAGLIREGLVLSAHDCSEGGLLVAVAEMLIGGHRPGAPIGADLDLVDVHDDTTAAAFAETSGRYVLEVEPGVLDRVAEVASDVSWRRIGHVTDTGRLVWEDAALDTYLDTLTRVWRRTVDW